MKRLDYKLTLCLVSLFISIILLIIGSALKNNHCLCFGLIFLSVALILFSVKRFAEFDEKSRAIDREMQEEQNDDMLFEMRHYRKGLKKQKRVVIFGGFGFALILIVLAISFIV